MANRNFHRVQSLTREVKILSGKVSIGASGASTLVVNSSIGISSIERDSAGVYKITLDDKYNELVGINVSQVVSAAEDLQFQVESDSISSNKEIQIRSVAAGVETDPSDGSTLLIELKLKNTSVSR